MHNKDIPLDKLEEPMKFTRQQLKALKACYDYLLSLPDHNKDQQNNEDADKLGGHAASSDPTQEVEDDVIIADLKQAASRVEAG